MWGKYGSNQWDRDLLYKEAKEVEEDDPPLETLEENWKVFTATYTGVGVRAEHYAIKEYTDINIFGEFFNPLYLDKLFHATFSYGISGLTWRAAESVSYRMEQLHQYSEGTTEKVLDYLEPVYEGISDPAVRASLSFICVGGFSFIKEFLMDKNPDGMDIAANYLGWGLHMAEEHTYK